MDDRDKTLQWLTEYCSGFRRARTRANILPYLRMQDRLFRSCASELVHSGKICSHATRGYWACVDNPDRAEIEAMKESYVERKAKALTMIADADKQIKRADDLLLKITQGQGELEL